MLEDALTLLAVLASGYVGLSLCVSLLGLALVGVVIAVVVKTFRQLL